MLKATIVFAAILATNGFFFAHAAPMKKDPACPEASENGELDKDIWLLVCKHEKAEKRLDAIKEKMIAFLSEEEKKCDVQCEYVKKFNNAQKAWYDWVGSEFSYKNYPLGGVGIVAVYMFANYEAEQMILRAKELEKDLRHMQTVQR